MILDMSNASIKCKLLTKKRKQKQKQKIKKIEEAHHVTNNTQTKVIVIETIMNKIK